MKDIESALQLAATGREEELRLLVHHPSPKVILRLLINENLSEELAIIIANRKNLSTDVLEALYNDSRWKKSYRVMLSLCKNRKTPQKISLSIIKSLRVLDIADLTRNKQIPINVRIRAEATINEKILPMPLGIKKTLAKKASSNILIKLIEDGMRDVVSICLDSPNLTEGDIYKVVSMKKTPSHVIQQIAHHPKWSCRYQIQWALILNNYTPLSSVVKFLKKMKTVDLKELYTAPHVPSSTKPFIHRELLERDEIILGSTH